MESLDKEICKALGWQWESRNTDSGYYCLEGHLKGQCLPHWSSRIDKAMELLEGLGLEWKVYKMIHPKSTYYVAEINNKSTYLKEACETAPTLPEAICRAYILYKSPKETIKEKP